MRAADTSMDDFWLYHVDTGEVRLHVAELGEGPPVLLLHGFPECWISWRPVMRRLAEAGYRAIAPDMRGYNHSEKPEGVASYHVDRLTLDVTRLMDELALGRAHLVGHDWGAVVAWFAAMRFQDRFSSLSICNVPHPAHYLAMMRDPAQLRRSSYIAFFQIPRLPEHMIRRDDFSMLRRSLHASRVPDTLGDEEMEEYVSAASRPGALTAMLNYYRALARMGPSGLKSRTKPLQASTLVLWGERDPFLGVRYAKPPTPYVPTCRTVYLPDCGHWVQMDAPERVATELIAHVEASEPW